MCGFRRLNSTSKRVLDLLEPADSLESCDRRITVVKFRMVGRGGNGAGCFEVTDTAKFVNVIIARFRKCSDLIREGKVFVKNTTKVASRVGCSERGVICTFESCCLSPIRRNSVLEELRVRRLAVIQEEICCTAFCE